MGRSQGKRQSLLQGGSPCTGLRLGPIVGPRVRVRRASRSFHVVGHVCVKAVAKEKEGAESIGGLLEFAMSSWPGRVTRLGGGDIRSNRL